MKKHILSGLQLIVSLLLLAGMAACNTQEAERPDLPQIRGERTFTLGLSAPQKSATRSILKDLNSSDIVLRWEVNSFDINIVYAQKGRLVDGGQVAPTITSDDHTEALIDLEIPQEIDITDPFDIYAIIGKGVTLRDGKLLVRVDAHTMYNLDERSSNKDSEAPMYCLFKGVTDKDRQLEGTFQHLGTMSSIVVKNSSALPFKVSGFSIVPKEGAEPFYAQGSLPFKGNGDVAYIDLLRPDEPLTMRRTAITYPVYTIAPGEVAYNAFWFRPTSEQSSEIQVAAYDAESRQVILTEELKPARKLELGKAYTLYLDWDGRKLTFLDEEPLTPLPEEQGYIELTTEKAVGETIMMNISADYAARQHVWIDLNNDGKREKGEWVTDFSEDMKRPSTAYKLQSQTFRIYGDVTYLTAHNQGITKVDASAATALEVLQIDGNKIESLDLSKCKTLRIISANASGVKEALVPISSVLEEVYLIRNQLKSFSVFGMTMYALDVSENRELTELNLLSDSYPMLMIFGMSECKLSKQAIESVYSKIGEPMIPKMYDWMYTMYSYGNPGSATADYMPLVTKGWTVFQTSGEIPDTKPLEPKPDEKEDDVQVALAYMAEYNLASDGTFKEDLSWNNQDYLSFDQVESLALPEGYHLPSMEEFSSVFPQERGALMLDTDKTVTDRVERIVVPGEEEKSYKADYKSTKGLVAYGLRFKSDDNRRLSAWKYERVYKGKDNGDTETDYLRITARHLGPDFDGNIDTISTEDFWKSNSEGDVVRVLPAAGFFAPVEAAPYIDHDGYFLTSTPFRNSTKKNYTADFYANTLYIAQGGFKSDSFTIRLFADKPIK